MKSLQSGTGALFVCCLVAAGTVMPCSAAKSGGARSSLKTAEGVVMDIGSVAGEGEIDVIRVTLNLEGKEENSLAVLLAPASVMEEIGFIVERGDTLRVKYFISEDGPAKAHKVRNESRGAMVRFRTLRQIPLWDNHGSWQGGPGGPGGPGGTHGGRHGGGGGGRR